MGRSKVLSGWLVALALAASVVLSSCGGGGVRFPPSTPGTATILLITADGALGALWDDTSGPPPFCPSRVFVNAAITFTFSGAVSPSSLPPFGLASGSINILAFPGGSPAQGTFAVEDDPALPAGNQSRVVFRPVLPSDPNAACASGLPASRIFYVTVPMTGEAPQVVVIDGAEITNGAASCFETCGCPDPVLCPTPFQDAVMGNPFVVSTTPATSDPAPPPLDPCMIAGDTIQILVNEALSPVGIDLSSVRVVNLMTGAQVPGTLVFHQAGTLPGLGSQSRIDYVASGPLQSNVTYQILLGPTVTDLVGNPIQTSAGNPAALLFFQTASVVFAPHQPLVESFDTPNPGGVSGALQWTGNGRLEAVFPVTLTGTGADGAFNPPTGITTILDTNDMIGGASRQGIWNFTNVTIPQTAVVRVIGPYLAHIRCTGSVTVNGTISVNPGTGNPALPATPPYDHGPETGFQNNNAGLNLCEARGGVANAGGGMGGAGSGVTPPTAGQCSLRVPNGESGFGPTINGTLNPGSPPNNLYAAGQGGDSGCFPSIGVPPCVAGDIGGLGGAGGTSGRTGEAGMPRQNNAVCLPVTNPPVVQPIAQPSPIAMAMIPPISLQSAGSGGGGGGDHFDSVGVPPNNDDQGGGGGGGGGGLRISCVGPYAQGTAVAGGMINATGAQGATAQQFGGCGGSGAGGEVWIQSFSTVTITANSVINVDGPLRFGPSQGLIGCSLQAAGGGGDGLVQIEAGQGPTPTASFMLLPTPTANNGAVFSAPPFPFAGAVTGHATSDMLDTQVSAPDFTSTIEVASLGNAAGATLVIRYEGFVEAVNSTPQNPIFDPGSLKSMATGGGPITGANIDELDGYRFIRWVVDVSFPAPPATPFNALLPFVDSITINYDTGTCP